MALPAEVVADGQTLTVEALVAVARHNAPASLTHDSKVLRTLEESRTFYLESGTLAYGDQIAIEANLHRIIPDDRRKEYQGRLIDALSCGTGEELPVEVSRGAMLLRANALIKEGCSAIGIDKIQRMIGLLNADIIPVLYENGSVSDGDLVPLASIAQVIQGHGKVWHRGHIRQASDVFAECGIDALQLGEKEGWSIANGTSASSAMAAIGIYDAEYLVQVALFCEALAIEALSGFTDHLHPFVHRVKNHPGQRRAAEALADYLQGSHLTRDIERLRKEVAARLASEEQPGISETKIELQDPSCLRCSAQVFGPTLELLASVVRPWVEREMNSANDNPIVNLSQKTVHHTGNSSASYIALAMDIFKIALFNVADLLHALKTSLLDADANRRLGPELAGIDSGLNSGFIGVDIVATEVFGRICRLADPASIHRRGSHSYNQDIASFAFTAAKDGLELIDAFRWLVASVLLVVLQAVDKRSGRNPAALADRTRAIYEQIRGKVSYMEDDRSLSADLETLVETIRLREISLFEAAPRSAAA